MPIRFVCPYCGAATEVSDQYAGQSGPCLECGRWVTVPAPGGAAAYAAAQPRSGSSGWGIVLTVTLIVALLAVVLLVIGIFACGGVLTALMLPSVQSAREAASRAQCANNLKQIALAMMGYEAEHGCFPPAYVADKDGRPMHSWRVLILPYLDQEWLYRQYRFDEPWDGPNNRGLADMMPSVFRCPKDAGISGNDTSYVVIVGSKGNPGNPSAVFCDDQPVKIEDMHDGISETILVVEVSDAGINWMEPQDFRLEDMDFTVNDPSGTGIQSGHPDGANAALGDGSVLLLPDSIRPATLKQLILRDDGIPPDMKDLRGF